MKDSIEKRLDRLSRKVVETSKLEHPSFDFTRSVLSTIEALKKSEITIYKPLISNYVWLMIAIFVAITFMAILSNTSGSSHWLANKSESLISYLNSKYPIESVNLSPSVGYAIIVFVGMISLQFWFVKRYLSKRFKF